MNRFAAGALGIVAIIAISYGAYTKFANPFAGHFTIHAVFPSANGLNPNSLVRIAGVNVGKVSDVKTAPGCSAKPSAQAACQAADVTMQIDPVGLPLHSDATFQIRPRIFVEGNFFVDLHPGSPSAPIVADSHTFPIQQGSDPVQIDQVLSSLQSNTRHNLQILLSQYGLAVQKSAPSFNASIKYWLPAYKYTGEVTHDLQGSAPHDLSHYTGAQAAVSAATDLHPPNLKSLITDFNTTASAFAAQQASLQSAVAELPRTLAVATPALNALNRALPPLEALSRALIPGVRTAGPAIDVSLPFITQLNALVKPSELEGLVRDLRPTIPALANLTNTTIPLMRNGVRPASACVVNEIIPWSHLTLNDPNFNASNGYPPHPTYQEIPELLPGIAGESRVYDANGPFFRVMGQGGTFAYSLQPGLFGTSLSPIAAVQPIPPKNDQRPPLQPNVACDTQAPITSLSAPSGVGPQAIHTTATSAGNAFNLASAKTLADLLITQISQQHLPLSQFTKAPTIADALRKIAAFRGAK
jgi:phospholipid/cholesterol/gamma-HCH transport system substrate-binding protein